LAGRRAADQYADRIVKKTYLWESRPEAFLKVRQEMGEALDKLARSAERELMRDKSTGQLVTASRRPLLEAWSRLRRMLQRSIPRGASG